MNEKGLLNLMGRCINRAQLWMELSPKQIAHCNATPALAKRKKPLTSATW